MHARPLTAQDVHEYIVGLAAERGWGVEEAHAYVLRIGVSKLITARSSYAKGEARKRADGVADAGQ